MFKSIKKLILPLLATALLFTTGCSLEEKEPYTETNFMNVVESYELEVEDVINETDSAFECETALLAYNDDFQMEFYLSESERGATYLYNNVVDYIEEAYDSGTKTNVSVSNYSKATFSYKKEYYYIERIDNTIIYGYTETGAKDEINAFVETLSTKK